MADKRFFRITRANGDVSYGGRIKAAAAVASAYRNGWTRYGKVPVKIEDIANVDVLPWQDITEEFISGQDS